MANTIVLFSILLICTIVNAQDSSVNKKPVIGQAFDEIVVSSNLNVRRKSKETRQGKKLLTNIPSGTTTTPDKSTAPALKLTSNDGSKILLDKRKRRGVMEIIEKRIFDIRVDKHSSGLK